MNDGRPRELTKGKIDYIIYSLQEDPNRSIRKIHNGLREFLIERIQQNYPEMTEEESIEEVDVGTDDGFREFHLLSESTIDKYVRDNNIREEIKRRNKQPDVLDRPWTIGSLLEPGNPIHDPKVIALIALYADSLRKTDKNTPLLVRQAWWMARLSCIPIENQELADKDSSYQMYLLYLVACCYSFIEKLMELSKYGHLGTADYDGETLEETARNFIKFFKNQPKMGGFPQLENLLKDAE